MDVAMIMRQIDGLEYYVRMIALYQERGTDPTVWVHRYTYERRMVEDALTRCAGNQVK